jgi:hypothetical protein
MLQRNEEAEQFINFALQNFPKTTSDYDNAKNMYVALMHQVANKYFQEERFVYFGP